MKQWKKTENECVRMAILEGGSRKPFLKLKISAEGWERAFQAQGPMESAELPQQDGTCFEGHEGDHCIEQ